MRSILHVDMDAFYASVEQRDDPSLRGKPMVVGGPSRRGVVAAASYEARKYGVRSAMPMAEALRKCPVLVVVPGRMARYAELSDQVFSIFRRYTPLVEGLSLDEAFLDVTASRALFGDGEAIATRIRAEIRAETQLTASAGVAPSKFVAKIASDQNKPDGLCVVRQEDVVAFLAPLPIERMWGLGPKSVPKAKSAGFFTFADLQTASAELLSRTFGDHGDELARLARGEDEREVVSDRDALSIGAEETFERDLFTREHLERALLGQAERVAERLLSGGVRAGGITVKIKYADFTLKTRATKLTEPVLDTGAVFRAARSLLDRFPDLGKRGVRLTGISAHHLVAQGAATTLFPDPEIARGTQIERARAALTERFGDGSLTRAALLDGPANIGGLHRIRRR